MRIQPWTTYQTGLHAPNDFEVMRDTTAELFSNVPWPARVGSVEIDGEIMRACTDLSQGLTRHEWLTVRDYLVSENGIGWKS